MNPTENTEKPGVLTPEHTGDQNRILRDALEFSQDQERRTVEAADKVRKWTSEAEKAVLADAVVAETGVKEQAKPTEKSELNDLTERILGDLAGKSDKEKIDILLSGRFNPAATNEAMAQILDHRDNDLNKAA